MNARPLLHRLVQQARRISAAAVDEREQHGPDQRDADRAPDRAAQRDRRRSNAERTAARHRLHRHLRGRHHHAKADADQYGEGEDHGRRRAADGRRQTAVGKCCERQADHREDRDVSGMRDESSRDRGRHDLGKRDRQQQRTRGADAEAAAELKVQGQVDDRREQAGAEAQHDRIGAGDRRHLEEMDGNDRIVVPPLPPAEHSERERCKHDERRHRPRAPREAMPTRRHREQEGSGGRAKQERADHIRPKRIGASRRRHVRHAQGKQRGDEPQRKIDQEHGAPSPVLGQIGAEDRPRRARECKDGCEVAGIATALARRHVLADERLRESHEAAAAQALQGAEDHEPEEARRESACEGRAGEHRERAEQRAPPPEAVADVTVERCGNGGGKQVGHDDPRQIDKPAERACNGGQCGGEDGLVGGGEEHRHHDAGEDLAKRPAVVRRRIPRGVQRCAGAGPGIGSNMRSST